MAVTMPLPDGQHRRRPLHHAGEGQRAQLMPDQEHGDHESEVADPVHDEGLLAGVGVHLVAEPEADQQVGAETHAFPADEHDREARPQHQHQHEHHEEVEVREVARVPRVLLHVADAEQVDQAPDAGDDQQHHGGELVHLKRHVELERADRHPAPEVHDDRGVRRMEPELDEHAQGHHEGRRRSTPTPTSDTGPWPRAPERQGPVDQEAQRAGRRR